MGLYDFELKDINGKSVKMQEYKDKVLLIVNTASQCGFTSQYSGLEALYREYKDRDFVVLGIPCNQFGAQEPGNEAEILSFCQTNYSVSFPMFSKIDVNGENAHPLYIFLKKEAPGILKSEGIKWNFTKFLLSRSGKVVSRFAPTDKPESLKSMIEELI